VYPSGMRFALLLALASCHYSVAVTPAEIELAALRLGEADFAEILHAVERVELSGEAGLKPGTFALAAEGYEAMEVSPGTRLRFEANVGIASVDAQRGDEALQVVPSVESFSLRFSKPVLLHGRASAKRVRLDGARLDAEDREQRLEVGVHVGSSLAGSLAAAVVGVPAGGHELPNALAMLERLEVPELRATLRRGSVLVHGDSQLYLRDASTLTLRQVDVRPDAEIARVDLEAELLLGEGTCLVREDARLCTDEMTLRVRGDYQRLPEGDAHVERLRLTQLDAPTRLEVGAGTLALGDETLGIESAVLQLDRYECAGAFGDDDLRCAYAVSGELHAGAGRTQVEGLELRFEGLHATGLRAMASDEEQGVRVARVRVEEPRLEVSGTRVALAALRLEGLQGTDLGGLSFASGDVIAEEGRLTLQWDETAIDVALGGETRVRLTERDALRIGGGEGLSFGVATEVERLEVQRDGRLLVGANGVHVDVEVTPDETRAELRLSEALRVDPSALADVAIADLRLQLRALRLVRRAQETRLTTEGLQLTMPQAQVLAALRPQIPPSFVGDEERLSPALEAALQAAGGNLGLGDLSRFRTRLEAEGLDHLELAFEGRRLRVQGDIAATVRLLADEHRVELAQCTHVFETVLTLPCFEEGAPALCERPVRVEVPHPCVQEEDVDAEVVAGSLRIGVDVSGEVETNAPSTLEELTLTARVARCDRVVVRGVNETLQRALDVEGMVCEQLREVSRTIALREVVAPHPLLAAARVERFELESDEEDLRIGIDVDVRLDQLLEVQSAAE